MKNRTKIEIITAILQCTMVGVTKYKLTCDAYLSLPQARRYISYLEENKMIQYNKKLSCYRITDVGREFLRLYQQMDDLFICKENIRIRNDFLFS